MACLSPRAISPTSASSDICWSIDNPRPAAAPDNARPSCIFDPIHWLAPDAREATCSRKCVHVLTPAERYLEFGCAADGTSGAAWRDGRLRRSPIYGSSRTSLQLGLYVVCHTSCTRRS